MKKFFLLLTVLGFLTGGSRANVNGYAFSGNPGSYTVYTGGILLGTISNNEQVFIGNTAGVAPPATGPGFPIGFAFNYNGSDYDRFAVSTNGWIVLGSGTFTIGSLIGNSTPISTAGPVGFVNAISALGMDLQGQSGSDLTFLNDGVAPYRVLIVQWQGYRILNESGDNFNFQIRLYETTNEVQFVFGSFTKSVGPGNAQVGIRGDDNSDFHNRVTTSSWSSTTQGTLNTNTCLLSPAVKPSTGLTFTFTPTYDFADAPAPYPTLLANNGARHNNTGLKLGNLIDIEINGFPDPAAMGDDNNNQDDEDGVWWPCNFVPGQVNTVKVTANGPGTLNAWFDFNQDGDWADPGEQVFTNVPLVAGTTDLFVTVPANATPGNTFARFRLSSQQNLSYTGSAQDGEVEDYGIIIQAPEEMDYGDAPDPTYPTLASSNGARHAQNPGSAPIFLGNLIDWEINGQPNALSTGDDNNNLPDEDGVLINVPLIPGQGATIQVTASMGGGALQAWIDFNADGDWSDPGEQIFTNAILVAGQQPLTFNVPANAVIGYTNARFRYSTMGNLMPYGCAPNGEVEDYRVYLGPLDFGDAPDPNYPTLLANDGARHHIDGITYLGNAVDAESNGFPSINATGDDLNNFDDEDGVTFLWPIAAGNPCKLKVTASVGNALLNAWIDFDRNGSWADPGEQIFIDMNLVAGNNFPTFIVPANVVPGPTFARFRFSHQPGLSYSGYASDGEVEDYAVTISDYGDIKWQQSYETTLPGLHSDQAGWVADDWICGGGMVTDIHWWGNYELDAQQQEERGQGISHFLIKIYSNANCLPGSLMQSYTVPFNSITEVNTGLLNSELCPIYYYEYVLSQPFLQIQGTVYWVSIQAISNNPAPPFNAAWRWQEANRWFQPISCGAASYVPGSQWITITWNYPPPGQYSDMAFIITSQVQVFDYGDAPDPTYPTHLLSNGARHKNTGLKLGNLIDVEPNGIPNATATGDDTNNLNDEDGVILNTPLLPGLPATITVTASLGGGAFQGWIDFNQDGDWMDPGEQVFTNTILVTGPQALSFAVPPNALLGNTYARYRYSTMGNLMPYGCAPNGEVEDYRVFVGQPEVFDFGDAPDTPYPTLLINNGASHKIANGTYLGSLVDAEADGQPSAIANGDDLTGLDDEDGVVFMWQLAAGNPCKLKVTASVGSALLNCWIDYNGNGSWADPKEHVYTDLNLVSGDNYLTFIVPKNAKAGLAFVRFRFSHQPALSYTGQAYDGEVEDYAVEITEYTDKKWTQPPETLLPGLHDIDAIKLADDWICFGGVVTDLHWWGNYELDPGGIEKRGAGINHFVVQIYSNSNCLPNALLKTYIVPFALSMETFTGLQNYEGSPIYKYDFMLPEPFVQTKDSTYWLAVQAISNNLQIPPSWRWQEANRWLFPIHCGAAEYLNPTWQTITWPSAQFVKYSDLAFEVTSWVVDSLNLTNINVASGQDLCYDATNVIIVAGNGTTFTVQNGGRATMIAGQKIRYLPGTKVFPGGYMHGYITTTGQYCNSLDNSFLATAIVMPEEQPIPEITVQGSFFKVYPNPTTGKFILELTGARETNILKLEIYSMLGEKIMTGKLEGQTKYDLSLATQQPGVYILHVISGKSVETIKVIKQ